MTDSDLRLTITDALEFEPSLDGTAIGVAVSGGIVTLSGHVPSYTQKMTAERIAMRIKGVRGLAEEIEVRPIGQHQTADDEIARRAADLLRWTAGIPAEAVKAEVEHGFVTLQGEVDWNYQRDAAAQAVKGLSAVKGVLNDIRLRPRSSPADVRSRIEKAFRRDAELDAAAIRVEVRDGTVTLEGKVDCWADRYAAESAAWAAPGVRHVDDRLKVA